MNAGAAIRAVDSSSFLQHLVGIKMLNNIKQMETTEMAVMLADFSASQPLNTNTPVPTSLLIGQNLDISV